MKLIPNSIPLFEQIARRRELDHMITNWLQHESTTFIKYTVECVTELERVSGIRCTRLNDNLIGGFDLVDEAKYMWFMMRWS